MQRLSNLPVTLFLAAALVIGFGNPARAQRSPASPGSSFGGVQGVITTQNGTIPLGGAIVSLSDGNAEVARLFSNGDGTFRFDDVRQGQYKLLISIGGFDPTTVAITIVAGQTAEAPIDLRLAVVAERVDVVASDTAVAASGTLSSSDTVGSREVEQIASGGGLQSALRLLASVIQVPGGVAIKGGRPSQASVQLGPGIFVDPATGLTQGSLPDDAIDSVTVLPNPYAVEFGRFSSGLVLVQTRRGSDRWRTRLNGLDPAFRTKRHRPLAIIGISSFTPRMETGGPLVKDRLFLQYSAQYRFRANDIPSRPQSDIQTSHKFSSFTRVDANLSPRHTLVAVGGVFPSVAKFATLGTFIPKDASVDTHNGAEAAGVTERATWTNSLFTETTVEMNRYHSEVTPQGPAPMQMFPDNTLGNFYNRQERTTSTYQFIESVSASANGAGGLHLFKAGIDVLRSDFSGQSASEPILIFRPGGTLARRLDYSAARTQDISSTDLALFAQDRWQPNSRWYLEFGGRLDRDGVIQRFNFTPRVGTAFLLTESGSATLRSGYGLFFERTPSAAGVFEQYEAPIETRYAADGTRPLGTSVTFRPVMAPDLRTPRSGTWDVAYDQRFNPAFALHVAAIDRRGSRELIVNPISVGSASQLLLDSSGRSRYREIEVGVHLTRGTMADLNATYVRSQARADLNAFTTFFDSVRAPVLGPTAWAPARTDAPHRLLARGRLLPTKRWLLVGVLDWRTGLPYSIVNESLDFVGPRNSSRFPTYFRVDLGLEHRFKIGKFEPWIGVRADNALNSPLPSDVQANLASPAFGSFYNSEFRQFRIQIRFE